jgi:dihydropteroate synthase
MRAFLIDVFDYSSAINELQKIGVSHSGRLIMSEKLKFIVIKLKDINSTALNILKQEALSIGAELANHKDIITGKISISDSLLFGTLIQLKIVVSKIKNQQFGLKELSFDIENILNLFSYNDDNKKSQPKVIKTNKGDIIFGGKAFIMGILNVTPDSFSDGGKYFNIKDAIKRGIEIEKEGADIIDIGGESTRPGAVYVDDQTEIDRVCPVIRELNKISNIPISIDTRKPKVAMEALKAGASIINDVSGLTYAEGGMTKVLINSNVSYILMHARGKTPDNMQKDLKPYNDTVYDVLSYFDEKISYLISKGVDSRRIIIDPGFGFAKSVDDNYCILKYISSFKSMGLPILAGVSRKSFINFITGKLPEDFINGSIALASYLCLKNVDIIRVHDVKQTVLAKSILEKLKN